MYIYIHTYMYMYIYSSSYTHTTQVERNFPAPKRWVVRRPGEASREQT